eukprot:CAMPEP_0184700752 /NCGR_PEP_ID=MMETSP0313-20130426/15846_1 /TAXON_ID=2792 /ORGANISM="Porphyridium aerugineum, Strain SAG 1380-2" /LENGTH=1146 /DNA_ID=CAMNT_0027160561 /DNA_START=49 /DNA_END=3489 /DNA_ORIENTATION=+
MSEEERIAAQRRFLAKRFGNAFEDEQQSPSSSPPPSRSSPPPQENPTPVAVTSSDVFSQATETSVSSSAAMPGATGIGLGTSFQSASQSTSASIQTPQRQSSPIPYTNAAIGSGMPASVAYEQRYGFAPAPSVGTIPAASFDKLASASSPTAYGRLSSPPPSAANAAAFHPQPHAYTFNQSEEEESSSPSSPWPGVSVDLESNQYVYDSAEHVQETEQREMKVKRVTLYTSPYTEQHGRGIASTFHLISYAVAAHIRVISSSSTLRTLLKGHSGSVIDMEFAPGFGNAMSPGSVESFLGSCGSDGSVFLWAINSPMAEEQDSSSNAGESQEVKCMGHKKWEHPQAGGSYSRIVFCKAAFRFALLDAESSAVRVITLALDVPNSGNVNVIADTVVPTSLWSSSGATVSSLTWLGPDMIAVGMSSGFVSICHVDSAQGITNFEAHPGRPISDIYMLPRDSLVTVDGAKNEIKMWSLPRGNASPGLVQSITIQSGRLESKPSFVIATMDPSGEMLVALDVPLKRLYLMHVNVEMKMIDCITEVLTKQEIISLCVLRKEVSRVESSVQGMSKRINSTDLQMYCVQLKAIQLYEVPFKDCIPRRKAAKVAISSPVSQSTFVTPTGRGPVDTSSRSISAPSPPPRSSGPVTTAGEEQNVAEEVAAVAIAASTENVKASQTATAPIAPQEAAPASVIASIDSRESSVNAAFSAPSTSFGAIDTHPHAASGPATDVGASNAFRFMICERLESSGKELIRKLKEQQSKQDASMTERMQRLCTSVHNTLTTNMQKNVRELLGDEFRETVRSTLEKETQSIRKSELDNLKEQRRKLAGEIIHDSDTKKISEFSSLFNNIFSKENLAPVFQDMQLGEKYEEASVTMADQIASAINHGVEYRLVSAITPELQHFCDVANQTAESSRLINQSMGAMILNLRSGSGLGGDGSGSVDLLHGGSAHDLAHRLSLQKKQPPPLTDDQRKELILRELDNHKIEDAFSIACDPCSNETVFLWLLCLDRANPTDLFADDGLSREISLKVLIMINKVLIKCNEILSAGTPDHTDVLGTTPAFCTHPLGETIPILVKWLNELLLVLEPVEEESADDHSSSGNEPFQHTLSELSLELDKIYKNNEVQHTPGLFRGIKLVVHLVKSMKQRE